MNALQLPMQLADAEGAELAAACRENGNRPRHAIFQKKVDRLIREKHDLRNEAAQLRAENT